MAGAGNANESKVATELQIATDFIRKVFEYTGKQIRDDFKCPPDMEIGSGSVEPRYAVWPDDRDLEMEYWIKEPFAMFEKGFQEKAFHLRETYNMVFVSCLKQNAKPWKVTRALGGELVFNVPPNMKKKK